MYGAGNRVAKTGQANFLYEHGLFVREFFKVVRPKFLPYAKPDCSVLVQGFISPLFGRELFAPIFQPASFSIVVAIDSRLRDALIRVHYN